MAIYNAVEELNSGLPTTNPDSSGVEDLNQGPPDIKSSTLNHSATLQTQRLKVYCISISYIVLYVYSYKINYIEINIWNVQNSHVQPDARIESIMSRSDIEM